MNESIEKEKVEGNIEKASFRLLENERGYWEQFLCDRTPDNMRPPRVILLSGETTANALAENGDISYTAQLARILSFEELKAVIAHEFWHILKRHGRHYRLYRRAVTVIEIFFYIVLIASAFAEARFLFFYASAIGLFSTASSLRVLYSWFSRNNEQSADKYAADTVGPMELARALVKLRKANKTPRMQWWKEYLTTHPHHVRRLRYLRRWRDEKRKQAP